MTNTDTRYNGFINRETYVWNDHFGDSMRESMIEMANDRYFDDAKDLSQIKSYIKAYSEELLDDCLDYCITGSATKLLRDLLGDHLINHDDMANHLFLDIMEHLEERIITLVAEGATDDELPAWAGFTAKELQAA